MKTVLKNNGSDPRLRTSAARIKALREDRGWSASTLAKKAGVNRSQIARLENGESAGISSDLLIRLSLALGVSADYILCLTNIENRGTIPFEKMGFPEEDVRLLLSDSAVRETVHLLLCQKQFSSFCHDVSLYVHPYMAESYAGRNALLDYGSKQLQAYAAAHPEKQKQVQQDTWRIETEKYTEDDVYQSRIEHQFRELLSGMKETKQKETPLTQRGAKVSDILAVMTTDLPEHPTPEDMAGRVMAAMESKYSFPPAIRNAIFLFVRFLFRVLGGKKYNHSAKVFEAYQDFEKTMEKDGE